MATPVFWEGNIGSAPEHRSFPNGNNPPRQLLRLNVMFDNSIPDGQGGYKDRGGFWCSVESWHQDAQRFAELFTKGMRVKVEGRAIMDRWPDKESGEEVQALKVEASRISILPHRLAEVTLLPSTNGPVSYTHLDVYKRQAMHWVNSSSQLASLSCCWVNPPQAISHPARKAGSMTKPW